MEIKSYIRTKTQEVLTTEELRLRFDQNQDQIYGKELATYIKHEVCENSQFAPEKGYAQCFRNWCELTGWIPYVKDGEPKEKIQITIFEVPGYCIKCRTTKNIFDRDNITYDTKTVTELREDIANQAAEAPVVIIGNPETSEEWWNGLQVDRIKEIVERVKL